MLPVASANEIPVDRLANTVVLAQTPGGELFFRVFNGSGEVVVDASESTLEGPQIQHLPRLRGALQGLLYRTTPVNDSEISGDQKHAILGALSAVLGHGAIAGRVNPFANLSNVRLTKVRPWIRGLYTTNNICRVTIRQLGTEQLQRKDKTVVSLQHEDVKFEFRYNWQKVVWNDKGGYVENPADCLQFNSVDGNLVWEEKYEKSKYSPLVGPFANWEVSIPDFPVNEGTDRRGISAIWMDFHGFFQVR